MAPKRPPPEADPEVSFNWPGGQQRRRPDPGVLEARVAQRRQRQQQPQPTPDEPAAAPPPKAQPPARREDVSPSAPRDRWIVTELRRQAVTTESSLRDV